MLDQMFTAENFRRVFDVENRKGNDLAGRFFPNIEPYTLAVKDKVKELREFRAQEARVSGEAFVQQVAALKKDIAALKAAKSVALDSELEAVSDRASESGFKIELTRRDGPKGKPVYCIDSTPETYFVVKQLQKNLSKLYGVKQSNRHDLVCRVRDMISSKFPFELVRTDISSFYESIDRKRLVAKLENDQLLSASSKKYVKQVLESYGRLAGTPNGIPRGVGVSAYLAELYLRPLDKKVAKLAGLVLYCRYVDDIVAIFARPPAGEALEPYEKRIEAIFSELGLVANPNKSAAFNLGSSGPFKFEYLGYRFQIDINRSLKLSPSAAKIRKYKMRLNAAFDRYAKERSVRSRRAYRNLVARVKFLTGNTRLANSKSSAVTGVYYNNSLADRTSGLALLDKLLKRRINGLNVRQLKKRLKSYGFEKGFAERRFHNFSAKELQIIVRAWKRG